MWIMVCSRISSKNRLLAGMKACLSGAGALAPLAVTVSYVALFMVCLASITVGQVEGVFTRHSVEQGLSNKSVFSLLVDREGFLWVGTKYGLNKFDGYDFTVYRPSKDDPHTLSNLTVLDLCEDKAGGIWVGTGYGGLNRFDKQTGKFTRYMNDPDDPSSISHNEVTAVIEDREGRVWVGTYGGGLNRMDRDTGEFTHYRHDEEDPESLCSDDVISLCTDFDGYLWLGTRNGLSRLDPGSGIFLNLKRDQDDHGIGVYNLIPSIRSDQQGYIWCGTYGALLKVDTKKLTFEQHTTDPESGNSLAGFVVASVYVDEDGKVWAGTLGGGLFILDPETNRITRYQPDPFSINSIGDGMIRAICGDNSGAVWLGTANSGLNKYINMGFKHYYNTPENPKTLSSNAVFAFLEDHDGVLWIGTQGGGLNRFDRNSGGFTHYRFSPSDSGSLRSDTVYALVEDKGGKLWVGTRGGGLSLLDKQSGTFEHFIREEDNPNSLSGTIVSSLCIDRDGELWIGLFDGGLNRFNRDKGDFTRYVSNTGKPGSLAGTSVVKILEDRDGILWLGTEAGLSKFDKKKEVFSCYKIRSNEGRGSEPNQIIALCEGQDSLLWAGSLLGLECFDRKTNQFIEFAGKYDLPNNIIFGILSDDNNNLWLSTDNGLIEFSPSTGEFRAYDSSDGLQIEEFNVGGSYKIDKGDRKGKMFFGGTKGFISFFPDRLIRNKHEPPIVLTSVNRSGEALNTFELIEQRKTIVLQPFDSWLTIEFAALDYRNPRKNLYAYMLEGLDKDWIYAGNKRRAEYIHLPPGEYVFRVKGSNNDGVWNTDGLEVKVVVLPPFWDEWWFRIAVAAAVVGLALLAYYVRVRSIKSQRTRLAFEVEERTKDLESFTYSVSHHLRAPLWRIDGYMDLLKTKHHEHLDTEGRFYLSRLGWILSRMHQIIEDLLKLSMSTTGEVEREDVDLSLLASTVASRLADADPARKVDFQIQKDLGVKGDERLLTIALENLMHNAWKFTAKRRDAVISFGSMETWGKRIFFLRDNGVGFDSTESETIFKAFRSLHQEEEFEGSGVGLAVVERIIRRHGGRIWADGGPDKGATFYFTLGK